LNFVLKRQHHVFNQYIFIRILYVPHILISYSVHAQKKTDIRGKGISSHPKYIKIYSEVMRHVVVTR
jgi:hypothetical protein